MKKSERQDPIHRIKQELDENLFEDLHFDTKWKEQIRESIHSTPKRFSFKDWLQRNSMTLGIGAVVMILFLILSPALLEKEEPQTFVAPTEEMEQSRPLLGTTSDRKDSLLLQDVQEAKDWFGEELFLPHYIPDTFKLEAIYASEKNNKQAIQVTFHYNNGTHSFMIIQNKLAMIPEFLGEQVDINGLDGFLTKSQVDNGAEWMELNWLAEGIHLTVSGTIPQTEVMNIAKSLK